jgi:hypothetical protein
MGQNHPVFGTWSFASLPQRVAEGLKAASGRSFVKKPLHGERPAKNFCS